MSDKLERKDLLDRTRLDRTRYVQSLLKEGYRARLLSDSELERIQMELVSLLAEQIRRFTRGESTSVPVETAQSLMQSVCYGLGEYLKSVPDPASALRLLQREPLRELFRRGKTVLAQQLEEAKSLYQQVLDTRLSTENRAYNDTIEGIVPFFTAYDPEFTAHETSGVRIDYPLCLEVRGKTGAAFIRRYLFHLLQENRFLQFFTPERIDALLQDYDRGYRELLLNLYEHVLIHALACALCRRDPEELRISAAERETLRTRFMDKTVEELRPVLTGAAEALLTRTRAADGPLVGYVRESAVHLAAKLRLALDHNALESFFVMPQEDVPEAVPFTDGKRMMDEAFRTFLEEVRSCRFLSDKIALIRRRIHSIQDMTDTLASGCLFGAEYGALFAVLGELELALLWKQIPDEENPLHATQGEREWQTFFSEWFCRQPNDCIARIRAMAARISLPGDE